MAAVGGEPVSSFGAWWFGDRDLPQRRIERLNAGGRAVALDERFDSLRQIPWACAMTSCVDPTARRLLEVPGKRTVVEQFLSAERFDATVLMLFRLFGSVSRPEQAEQPPRDRQALRLRRQQAGEILNNLAAFATPNGRVWVEGWDPRHDWLRPRDLAPHLLQFGKAQVFIFGIDGEAAETLRSDEDLAPLIDAGTVVTVRTTLTDWLAELGDQNELRGLTDPRLEAPEVVSFQLLGHSVARFEPIDKDHFKDLKTLEVSQQEWRTLNESFEILLPIGLSRPIEGTEHERYRAFRDFVGRSPDLQLDRVRQFAFRRPILDKSILPEVIRLLQHPSPQDYAIILEGQSGVGKTTLVSLLAVDLREAGVPVVFIRSGVVPPDQNHLDRFAARLESVSRIPVVIIYDGLLKDYDYLKIAQFLAARGRKVVIVGTCYRAELLATAPQASSSAGTRRERRARVQRERDQRSRTRTITIPVAMDKSEREDLVEHLARFLPQDRDTVHELSRAGYDNFFAILYHLLDSARPRLVQGLLQEIQDSVARLDHEIRRKSATKARERERETHIQQAMREALGRIVERPAEPADDGEDRLVRSAGLGLVNVVMLASLYNLDTPQSIALAVLRGHNYDLYRQVLESFQVLQTHEIEGRLFTLRARLRLEATLWCEREIPTNEKRFEIIRELITGADTRLLKLFNDERSLEHEFVVQLLQRIGPQGPSSMKLERRFYQRIADIVHTLRERFTRISPRLLLIESNATREAVLYNQQEPDTLGGIDAEPDVFERSVERWVSNLKRAEESLIEARDIIEQQREERGVSALSPGGRRLLSVLETERACVLGVQQGCLKRLVEHYLQRLHAIEQGEPVQDGAQDLRNRIESQYPRIDEYLMKARRAWRQSLAIDEENQHALNTACWILRERVEAGALNDDRRNELFAEWNEILDLYGDLALSDEELDQLEGREAEYRRALGDETGFRATLERMEKRNSPAANSLRARYLDKDKGPEAARRFLEEKLGEEGVLRERSTLMLYYRLWWRTETGLRSFFERDALCLSFSAGQWQRLVKLAEARLALEGERDNNVGLFHLGWGLLQLGETQRSSQVFDRLATVSLSYRRGRSLALISQPDGRPREFVGEYRGRVFDGRGLAWIDDLRLEVRFSPLEFPLPENRSGLPVGPFHLALNYRGVFAQPIHRYKPIAVSTK